MLYIMFAGLVLKALARQCDFPTNISFQEAVVNLQQPVYTIIADVKAQDMLAKSWIKEFLESPLFNRLRVL